MNKTAPSKGAKGTTKVQKPLKTQKNPPQVQSKSAPKKKVTATPPSLTQPAASESVPSLETNGSKSKAAKSDSKTATPAVIPRPHSVENMIKTAYRAPKAKSSIEGATFTLKHATSFSTEPNATHICFISKEAFGTQLLKDGDDDDDDDDDKDGDQQSSSKPKKAKSPQPLNLASLKSTYSEMNWESLTPALKVQGFTAAEGEVAALPNINGIPTLIVGVGKLDKKTHTITPSTYRKAITAGIKAAMKIRSDAIAIQLPNFNILEKEAIPTGFGLGVESISQSDSKLMDSETAVLQGVRQVVTTNYSFDAYLKPATVKTKHHKIKSATLVGKDFSPQLLHNALHRAESENFAKEIGSLRSNLKTNAYMKQQCEALVKAHPDVLSIKVLDKEALTAEGHSLLLAVNQGSDSSPYLVGIEYTPPARTGKATTSAKDSGSFVYIGKTLTFDTGGINVKNEACGIHHMSLDALGGCHTLALMRTLALTRPQTNKPIVGVLTITDNLVGSKAIRPSDVFHTPKGSVSIDHTDAEGRLALADAITFAQKYYDPIRITTMATLTGAIITAVGHNTGLFSNNRSVANDLIQTGDSHGEVFWSMPILKENHSAMEPSHTDLTNDDLSSKMGSSTAAAFLEKFVDSKKVSFVHLDIAGSATDKDEIATGATISTLQTVMAKH